MLTTLIIVSCAVKMAEEAYCSVILAVLSAQTPYLLCSDGKKRLKWLKPTKKKTIFFFSLDLQQQNDRKTFWNTAPSMSQYDTCGCRSSLVTA